jgi:hypothetical protein
VIAATGGTPAALAAKAATTTIPIVSRRHESMGQFYDINDINDKSPTFGRLNRFGRTPSALERVFAVLEARCPDYIEPARWRQCVEDGSKFLALWGEQAEALGWTSADLFGLRTPPERPHPSYSRLSRYDCTGLCWLLQGRPVVALTEATTAILNPTGNVTTYRKDNKPALGPLNDSLDDLNPEWRQ